MIKNIKYGLINKKINSQSQNMINFKKVLINFEKYFIT